MNKARKIVIFWAALLLGALVGCANKTNELKIFCAAGVRKPVEQILNDYEKAHKKVSIFVSYAGSGKQVAQVSIQKKGDIMILGNAKFMDTLVTHNLVVDSYILAYHIPVLAFKKGNPKKVKGLADFLRADVKYSLGDKKVMALGMVEEAVFKKLGVWEKVKKRAYVYTASAPQTLNYLKLGTTDMAILWKSNVISQRDIDFIEIPELSNLAQPIPIVMMKNAKNNLAVQNLYDFIIENRFVFMNFGYN